MILLQEVGSFVAATPILALPSTCGRHTATSLIRRRCSTSSQGFAAADPYRNQGEGHSQFRASTRKYCNRQAFQRRSANISGKLPVRYFCACSASWTNCLGSPGQLAASDTHLYFQDGGTWNVSHSGKLLRWSFYPHWSDCVTTIDINCLDIETLCRNNCTDFVTKWVPHGIQSQHIQRLADMVPISPSKTASSARCSAGWQNNGRTLVRLNISNILVSQSRIGG